MAGRRRLTRAGKTKQNTSLSAAFMQDLNASTHDRKKNWKFIEQLAGVRATLIEVEKNLKKSKKMLKNLSRFEKKSRRGYTLNLFKLLIQGPRYTTGKIAKAIRESEKILKKMIKDTSVGEVRLTHVKDARILNEILTKTGFSCTVKIEPDGRFGPRDILAELRGNFEVV